MDTCTLSAAAKTLLSEAELIYIQPTSSLVLTAHASVVDASVVGWPGGEMGEEVAAFVVVKHDVREAQLIEHCREKQLATKSRNVFFSSTKCRAMRAANYLRQSSPNFCPRARPTCRVMVGILVAS